MFGPILFLFHNRWSGNRILLYGIAYPDPLQISQTKLSFQPHKWELWAIGGRNSYKF